MDRQAFLARYKACRTKEVKLPDGTTQHVRAISPKERDAFDHFVLKEKDKAKESFRATWLALVLCDDKGKRLFEDADVPELNALAGGGEFEILFDESYDYNGMTQEARDTLKKSSATATGTGSSSTSASPSASPTPTSSTARPTAGASA